MPGFDTDAIEEIIRWYPNGNHTDLDHEIERRRIAKVNDATATNRRYDVLEYWGQVTGADLQAAGVRGHAAMRATLDNLAISSGPQIEVNLDLLAPGESAKDFYGWRVWGREGGDSGQPLLRVYDMENVTQ